MSEENKALVRRMVEEMVNKRNLAVADELFLPTYVNHNPFPGQKPGPQGVKDTLRSFLRAFPDLHETLEDLIAEGDKVVARSTIRGTHTGDFQGLAQTGKEMRVMVIDVFRIAGGKIVASWIYADTLRLLEQLRAAPSTGPRGS